MIVWFVWVIRAANRKGLFTSYYTNQRSDSFCVCVYVFVTSEFWKSGIEKFLEIFRATKKSRIFRDYFAREKIEIFAIMLTFGFFWLYDFFGFYDIFSKIWIFSIFLIGFEDFPAAISPRLSIRLGIFWLDFLQLFAYNAFNTGPAIVRAFRVQNWMYNIAKGD